MELAAIFVAVLCRPAIMNPCKAKPMHTPTRKARPQAGLPAIERRDSPIQAQPAIRMLAPEGSAGLTSVRRLVVLVPAADMDEVELAKRIWELAAPAGLAVLFLGLCPQIAEEPAMQRRLITLASLTRDERVPLETRIEFGRDWLPHIRAIHQTGDVILCHAEQNTGLMRKPLSRALESLGGPVWTLAGFYPSRDDSAPGPLAEFLFWGISMAILAAFFWLQIWIARLHVDWARNMLLYLSILAEAGLLGAWHHYSV